MSPEIVKNSNPLNTSQNHNRQHGGQRARELEQHQDKTQPLISIITVVYNSEDYLEATIKSVLNQSYDDYEYIIIDGGSSDRTLEIIQQYDCDLDYWISERDRGIYDAMNKGIALARGKIIGILNSGDLYAADALAIVAQLYLEHQAQESLIITGAMYRFDEQSQLKFKQERSEIDLHRDINVGMPLNHPATFVIKKVYDTVGYFNPQYKICGDHDFLFRVYHSQQVKFIFTDRVLASMTMGGVSEKLSSLWIRATEKIAIRKDKLNIIHNLAISARLILVGYIKHLLIPIAGQNVVLIKHKIKQALNH